MDMSADMPSISSGQSRRFVNDSDSDSDPILDGIRIAQNRQNRRNASRAASTILSRFSNTILEDDSAFPMAVTVGHCVGLLLCKLYSPSDIVK